ncbi:unnamed protein product [Musa textilis]
MAVLSPSEIEYLRCGAEHHLPLIMGLVDRELGESYSIFTYRYFVYLWPNLTFLVLAKTRSTRRSASGRWCARWGIIGTPHGDTSGCWSSSSPTGAGASQQNLLLDLSPGDDGIWM